MADTANLRLIRDEHHEGDPIPLERRVAHRKPMTGRVTALQSFEGDDAQRNRICSLQLQDISDTGLGARTEDPVPADTAITIFFPPHGPERGFDLYGQVVWCRRIDDGHEIGVRLNQQEAACA